MRFCRGLTVALLAVPSLCAHKDWPVCGHDAGRHHLSPLKQYVVIVSSRMNAFRLEYLKLP